MRAGDDVNGEAMTGVTESANDRWWKRHSGHTDRPSVRVWCPTSGPFGRLQTFTTSSGDIALPKGQVLANITIGGVEFGGPLDDLELMFEAVAEWLGELRQQATKLQEGDPDA